MTSTAQYGSLVLTLKVAVCRGQCAFNLEFSHGDAVRQAVVQGHHGPGGQGGQQQTVEQYNQGSKYFPIFRDFGSKTAQSVVYMEMQMGIRPENDFFLEFSCMRSAELKRAIKKA